MVGDASSNSQDSETANANPFSLFSFIPGPPSTTSLSCQMKGGSYGTLDDSTDSDSSTDTKPSSSKAKPTPPSTKVDTPSTALKPPPQRAVVWQKGSIIYGIDLSEDPFPEHPSFFLLLLLLVLIGVRPKQLAHRLKQEDPLVVWKEFRDSNVKRWASLSVLGGLMLAATATVISLNASTSVSNNSPFMHIPTTIALAGRCAALTASAIGTGLSLVFADASPKDFARLAQTPLHMAVVMGGPAFFAIAAMILFYGSLLSDAWVQGTIGDQVVTTAFGGVILFMIGYACWLAFDVTKHHEVHHDSAPTKEC